MQIPLFAAFVALVAYASAVDPTLSLPPIQRNKVIAHHTLPIPPTALNAFWAPLQLPVTNVDRLGFRQ
ncbi:hypothetical protein CWI70_09100 [Pseudidiomarina homiensis]|uniref:Uncharacterized protein n=1 Tax=Pseudidiomarina homiensis TaxID=364198 RepID=A0A432Y7B8_9GAMM|nr:hypothetical protein CWI70_09100 [Pseudidiomarina homiensis]